MELSSSRIKKNLICLYIPGNRNALKIIDICGNRNPKKFLVFQKNEFSCPQKT